MGPKIRMRLEPFGNLFAGSIDNTNSEGWFVILTSIVYNKQIFTLNEFNLLKNADFFILLFT